MKKQIQEIQELKKGKFSWRLFGENFVFQDEGHFYKMPSFLARNIMYRKTDSYEKVIDSMRIINTYFGPIAKIPKTAILKDVNGHYIIKQENISGEKLSKKNLSTYPKILSKFRRLVIANELMWLKEGVFLDLLGSDILTQPNTIHNLFTDGENIYIFDFGLLEKKSKSRFFRYFSHFGTRFQLYFIKRFFEN